MTRILTTIALMFLSACATPYQPEGSNGGYVDYPLADGKYRVAFSGNGFTDSTTVRQFAFRRSMELCQEKGQKSFEIVSDEMKTETDDPTLSCYNGSCNTIQGASKSAMSLVIRCKN